MGLYAADNAFQRLKRYLMLWNVAHLWKKASMLILINYRHHNIVYVYRAPVEAPIIIHSKEGISQGCGMAMQAYGIELLPLCQRMNEQLPGVTKPWYSDDALSIGMASDNVQCLAFLVQYGRMYGYFTQPATSWYVCKAEDEAIAREEFTNLGLTIRFSPGQQYLGGFFGCKECKDAWLTDSCNKWAAAVGTLAKLADRLPQTAYSGLNFVLQNQWQYVQRVILDTGAFFEPVERALRQEFIPALMGLPKDEISGCFRELLSQSVGKGGIGIRNPVDRTNHVQATSLEAASYLVMSMIDTGKQFSVTMHNCNVSRACAEARKMRLEREQDYLSHWAEGSLLKSPGWNGRARRVPCSPPFQRGKWHSAVSG